MQQTPMTFKPSAPGLTLGPGWAELHGHAGRAAEVTWRPLRSPQPPAQPPALPPLPSRMFVRCPFVSCTPRGRSCLSWSRGVRMGAVARIVAHTPEFSVISPIKRHVPHGLFVSKTLFWGRILVNKSQTVVYSPFRSTPMAQGIE